MKNLGAFPYPAKIGCFGQMFFSIYTQGFVFHGPRAAVNQKTSLLVPNEQRNRPDYLPWLLYACF